MLTTRNWTSLQTVYATYNRPYRMHSRLDSPQSPKWDLSRAQQAGSLDLTLLLAIQLSRERQLPVRLVTTLGDPDEHSAAESYLEGLRALGRLPKETSALAFVGNIWDAIKQAPPVRIQIFGMPLNPESVDDTATDFIDKVSQNTVGECCLSAVLEMKIYWHKMNVFKPMTS